MSCLVRRRAGGSSEESEVSSEDMEGEMEVELDWLPRRRMWPSSLEEISKVAWKRELVRKTAFWAALDALDAMERIVRVMVRDLSVFRL